MSFYPFSYFTQVIAHLMSSSNLSVLSCWFSLYETPKSYLQVPSAPKPTLNFSNRDMSSVRFIITPFHFSQFHPWKYSWLKEELRERVAVDRDHLPVVSGEQQGPILSIWFTFQSSLDKQIRNYMSKKCVCVGGRVYVCVCYLSIPKLQRL